MRGGERPGVPVVQATAQDGGHESAHQSTGAQRWHAARRWNYWRIGHGRSRVGSGEKRKADSGDVGGGAVARRTREGECRRAAVLEVEGKDPDDAAALADGAGVRRDAPANSSTSPPLRRVPAGAPPPQSSSGSRYVQVHGPARRGRRRDQGVLEASSTHATCTLVRRSLCNDTYQR